MKHEKFLESQGIDLATFYVTLRDHILTSPNSTSASKVFTSWAKHVEDNREHLHLRLTYTENHVLGIAILTLAQKNNMSYLDVITITSRASGLSVAYQQKYSEVFFDAALRYYRSIS